MRAALGKNHAGQPKPSSRVPRTPAEPDRRGVVVAWKIQTLGKTVSRASPVGKAAHDPATLFTPTRGAAAILVVEDEILVRAMVTDELRDQGYTVIEAADADEALAILHSNVRVDLLLTDVRMPGTLDGVGLARLVRAEHPTVKVVMASGQMMPDTDVGKTVDGFFAKPYDVPRLIERINALLAPGTMN
jgi:CheY-like chemotaxis protein